MAGKKQIGVRNITMIMRDCDTPAVYGPVAHKLATDDQPQYRLCEYNNEPLPGGRSLRSRAFKSMTLSVFRIDGIPLRMYQGCAEVDIVIEHYNGIVVTGIEGIVIEDPASDGTTVELTIVFGDDNLEEKIPPGLEELSVLAQAA